MEIIRGVGRIGDDDLLKLSYYLKLNDLKHLENYNNKNISSWKITINSFSGVAEINYVKYNCACGSNMCLNYKWFVFGPKKGVFYIRTKKEFAKWCKKNKKKYNLDHIKNNIAIIEREYNIQQIIVSYDRLLIEVIDHSEEEKEIKLDLITQF